MHREGTLNPEAVGWSRHPLHTCNLRGRFPRKKRWNYWCITTRDFLFSATVSDIDYLGLAFVYFLDFRTGYFHEKTVSTLLGRGFDLPPTADGDVEFVSPGLTASFLNHDQGVKISVDIPAFDGKVLTARLEVQPALDHETSMLLFPGAGVNSSLPQAEYPPRHRHSATRRRRIRRPGRLYLPGPGPRNLALFQLLELGLGFGSQQRATPLASNFGAGWTDGTGLNENGICIDGGAYQDPRRRGFCL